PELFQSQHQLFDATSEAVKPPDHDGTELAPSSTAHERLEPRSAFLDAARAVGRRAPDSNPAAGSVPSGAAPPPAAALDPRAMTTGSRSKPCETTSGEPDFWNRMEQVEVSCAS